MLKTCAKTPMITSINVTEDVVNLAAKKLLGSSGKGGTDYEALQRWILKLGRLGKTPYGM